jgi:DNA-binding NarL/FixJ family response regulator
MSIAISNALSVISAGAASAPAAAQQQTQVQEPASDADTVTLTEAQQVYNLYNEGQTVLQISTSLSLPVGIINNYLGITTSG